MNLSCKSGGETKTFSNKQKLREFDVCIPSLQEMLKEVLQREGKSHRSKPQIKLIDTVNEEIRTDTVLSENVYLGQGGTYFCLSYLLYLYLF